MTESLSKLRDRRKALKKGYRLGMYDVYQGTMENAIKMLSDPSELKKFVELAGIDAKKLKRPDKSWIMPACFTFVTGNEQLGWKAARASEFLHKFQKIPISKLAEQMRKLGGIEKIVRLAAKEDPLRARKQKGETTPAAKKGLEGNDDLSDRGHPKVAVRGSPRLVAKIAAIKPDRRVKLVCVREGKTTLRLVKVTPLRPRIDPTNVVDGAGYDDENDAWE